MGRHYTINKRIREISTRLMANFPDQTVISPWSVCEEEIRNILLVRANFRMGNSILAIPAIHLFRRQFPGARIDFVGSPVSKVLLQNLPIDSHYEVIRGYRAAWWYPALLQRLRAAKYDLAIELSCSQSALGSFIVGLSGARWRVGSSGKRDFWYNVKIPRSAELNKYRLLHELVASLGFEVEPARPQIALSRMEQETGKILLKKALGSALRSCVGIFIGARARHGKRWPLSKFSELAVNLKERGVQTVVFVGPEEGRLIDSLKNTLPAGVPVILEQSLRLFASMLSHCRLFVSCDSGPMHLACAVGVRTVAIFQNPDFNRWAPPPEAARVVYDAQGVAAAEVEAACLDELFQQDLHATI